MCALQALLVGLRSSFALTELKWIQPVTATLIPILAYLSLLTLSQQSNHHKFAAPANIFFLHSIPVALVLISLLLSPKYVDALLFASYFFYGCLIFWKTRSGADSLTIVRLEAAGYTLWVWRIIAIMLLLLALVDLVIAFDGGLQSEGASLVLATASSTLMILILAIALSISSNTGPAPSTKASMATSSTIDMSHKDTEDQRIIVAQINSQGPLDSPKEPPAEEDLMPRIEEQILRQKLYRDPNLNLAKLARKLGIPPRKVSQQVNQATELNVSQYINRFRIKEACERLKDTDQRVTEIMLEVGFFTKSNFNREFLRITRMSPSAWRASQQEITKTERADP
ncbi:hypothetical protein BGP75_16490 [Motiliproteus sp. MSK22-1]|nr:hypothetical protein BGP75_16490 [Motiliproteus sp. MSK22-1]